MSNKLKALYPYIACFLIALITLLSCSAITSFVYPRMPLAPYYNDAATFYVLGTSMANGYKPYAEVFDHKGLYIFYYTMIGAVMGRFGVFLIQLIVITAVEIFIYKAIRLYSESWKLALAAMFIFGAMYAFTGQTPNDADLELPFVAAMIYFYLKGVKEESFKEFFIGNIFVGVSTGIALNLRVSDALLPFAFVCYYGYWVIKNKKVGYLFRDMFTVLGIIAVLTAIPMMHAYFGGFFTEMVHAVYLDNFKYIFTTHDRTDGAPFVLRILLPVVLSVFILLMILKRKELKKQDIIFISVTSGVSFLIEFIIAFYPHYLIILFPYLPVILFRLLSLYEVNLKFQKISLIIASSLMALSLAFNPILYATTYQTDINDLNYVNETLTSYDKDGHTLVFGMPALYYDADIKVGYRDFTAQYNHQLISEYCTYESIVDYVASDDCSVVIIHGDSKFAKGVIKNSGATYNAIPCEKETSIVIYRHVI